MNSIPNESIEDYNIIQCSKYNRLFFSFCFVPGADADSFRALLDGFTHPC